MDPSSRRRWLAVAEEAFRAVDRHVYPPDEDRRLMMLLGGYKAISILATVGRRHLADGLARIISQALVTDPADPRLLEVPPEVESSPAWRPFGNRDVITLYRAAWIALGLHRTGIAAAPLEEKILAAQHPGHGGFPNAFGEFPARSFGVNPTFMVLWALLEAHRWDELSAHAQVAVRRGARFLREILRRNREAGGTFYPAVDEAGDPVTESHPRFDRELFFLQRVHTREPVEHVWLVAGPAMAGARWARRLEEAGQSGGADYEDAQTLALESLDAVLGCARPLENLSVGKLICAALDLLALAGKDPACARRREEFVRVVTQATDFLCTQGQRRPAERTRWYWEKYHPKRDGRPADAPCPPLMTAGMLDYTVEIAFWIWSAATCDGRLNTL